ncbi:LysR family transcriptional regulator [Pseudoroseicyclus aestuarii]|uniref:LysR family transcriptional regulator n=2 Tax=Pseudoroseicyclus aestuarii TaxID=1795041 RepID=A0A318SQ29_9RHOB|nr:LysR family transcriptional regulator [Pseudoroseicyclus aestuarii]
MPPSWDDQQAFLAVLEEGSLSAAARRLGVTQPTMRSRIAALEARLGVTLFTRSSQGLLPTPQARALEAPARAMAHASDAFLRTAASPPGLVAGRVRLSVADFVGVEVLPAMLPPLLARHPGLRLELALSNRQANLTEQEADLAVRMHPPAQDTLVTRRIGEIPIGLFGHRDYLAARGRPQRLEDLAQHSLIGPDRSAADLALAEQLLGPRAAEMITLRVDNHPAQLAMARAGLGLVFAQRPVGRADPRLIEVLEGAVTLALPVWVVAHRDLRALPRVGAVFDHLVAALTRYVRTGRAGPEDPARQGSRD